MIENISKNLISLKRTINSKKLKKPVNLLKVKSDLEKYYGIKVDYLDLRNEVDLKLNSSKSKKRLFIAYYIKNVRLIDNF